MSTGLHFGDVRATVAHCSGPDAALIACARHMLIWHENNQRCGRCGHHTLWYENGWSRSCSSSSCRHTSYPRTDPVAIMLVEDDTQERVLLGRQKHFLPGVYANRLSCTLVLLIISHHSHVSYQ
jgi:NAD+ diphosphatase